MKAPKLQTPQKLQTEEESPNTPGALPVFEGPLSEKLQKEIDKADGKNAELVKQVASVS